MSDRPASRDRRGHVIDGKSSAVCKMCLRRQRIRDLRQGGGLNNFRCADEVACAARAAEEEQFDQDFGSTPPVKPREPDSVFEFHYEREAGE